MSTASRTLKPLRGSLDREIIFANIIFAIDNAGDVSGVLGKEAASMVKTGAGTYKLTLNRKFPELLHINILPATTNSDVVWTLVSDNLSVDGSVDIASSDFAGQKNSGIGMYVVVQLTIKFSSIVG